MECVPIENEIVDAGIEHLVASGHALNRTWCDVCVRTSGIGGRHEKRELGREDEDPLVAMDYGYLRLDHGRWR